MKNYLFPRAMFIGLAAMCASMTVSIAGLNMSLAACLALALWDKFSPTPTGWRQTPLDESLIILVAMTFLSSLFSMNAALSLMSFRGLWIFLIYYFYVWYVSSERSLKLLVGILCGFGGLVSIYAIFQHYYGLDFFGEPSRTLSPFAGEAVRFISKGTFSHHQTFANVYFMIFCLAFSLALVPAPFWKRTLTVGIASVLAVSVIFSYTRGIWLATLVAILLIALFRNRRAFSMVLVTLALVGAVIVTVPSSYSSRARSIFALSENIDRLIIWEISWAMLRDHPILGIGLGNYPELQDTYAPPQTTVKVSRAHAHNSYLQLAIERGIFAIVAFGWIWYVVLRVGFSSLWFLKGQEGFRLAAIRGSTAGVVGFLIDGFFQNNFGDTEVIALLLFLVAVIIILRVKQAERESVNSNGGGVYASA